MSKIKKALALVIVLTLALTMFAACGEKAPVVNSGDSTTTTTTDTGKTGKVYFLNFKPEQEEGYKTIAADYTKATGVEVNIVTAAAGTYEQQLTTEIAKADAPTIFQVNGPVGYANWKDYCADLKDAELYTHLMDKSIAITDGDGVYGIPFAIEGYGIIYNNAIMEKYFALDGAKAKTVAEINTFAKLKEVADDMQAKKADLGIKGVFASTSLKAGEDWRWQTHLANIPIFNEFTDNKIDLNDATATAEIKFQNNAEFKNIFDLYLADSTVDAKLTGSKSVNDSMAEFALGECAMVQNGNWAYGQVSGVEGNTVKPEDVKFMPIYTGAKGEETQGICVGTENFFCINKNASAEDQKASLDFLTWLYTSPEGKAHVTKTLGFIAPFDTFSDTEKPTDPLATSMLEWSANTAVKNIPWNFTIFPSQTFKDNFGAALLEYAQGKKSWDDVSKLVVEQWKYEKANAADNA